jgi:hypothetical protein
MRFTPMSVSEQCNLEREMLEHFGLAHTETTNVYNKGQYQTYKHWKIRDDKRARQAISISQAFFRIAELPDAPVDAKEMELAIRYEMGYGWWAWFFFRNFAWPIIQYLWKRYHKK